MAILDFDLSSLKGKKIESARLYLRNASENNMLRKIGISTVASPWVEGKSRGYFVDILGKGATFLYSSYKKQRWAGQGSDLTDVTMGRGSTWQHHTELIREKDGWWYVDIASELVYAMITGKSHGLLVMDESGQTFANNFVFSRESDYPPYIMIICSDITKKRPFTPYVKMSSSPADAHMEYGAVALHLPVKEDIFAFDISINDEEAPLWRIPRPVRKGNLQEIVLDWLPPGKEVNIKISVVDELGQRSEPAFVKGFASGHLERIAFRGYAPAPRYVKEELNEAPRHFRVWAMPDVTKIDPVSGDILSEENVEGFDRINPVWSGYAKQITLVGIRGEIIGFQLCIEAEGGVFEDTEIRLTPLEDKKGTIIPSDNLSLFQAHYLRIRDKWYPEYVIPLHDGKLNMKLFQTSIGARQNQLIYIDFNIPSETTAGLYRGKINVYNKGELRESLVLNLNVKDISMPQKLSFVPELNMYDGPGKAGTEKFFQAHRIAHEHRAVINRVPYSQDGKVHEDMVPTISFPENGPVRIEWEDYDRRLGPLFDGSAFSKEGRKGVPVEKFYLPFFENWPSQLAPNYKYEFTGKKTQEIISRHAMDSVSLNEALTTEYKNRFLRILREFIKHFEAKEWNQTEFQFYLNNTWDWDGASSWWDLDEPVSYDDWMSLRFYGSLFKQATEGTRSNFIFRADISRPQWQHDWMSGILDRMYVQDKVFFEYSNRIRQLKKDGQISFSVYGSLNDIEASNQQTAMWCMGAYIEGADGVLPWQSQGGPSAFTTPDKNALIVGSDSAGYAGWVVSLRVKALRRCQQNVELLSMLEKKKGYKHEQVRDFFYRAFSREKSKDHIDSIETVVFQNVDTYRMENFRNTLIEMLAN
ncbi:MAG: hypothetical protein HZA16_15540 [Nitrospirae bacterium]|nr:hypothetical protein [Nitrospirota bacterium]